MIVSERETVWREEFIVAECGFVGWENPRKLQVEIRIEAPTSKQEPLRLGEPLFRYVVLRRHS
jgi:hypothetical protein